jgi:hypothetical protein
VKAPFRVLYSNDCSCAAHVSPYHKEGEPFTADKLRAAIDEAAGADAFLLQPGSCEVAHWRSRECPIKEHYRWFEDAYGVGAGGHAKYVLEGGDVFDILIEHCRKVGIAPFASLRLNDAHGKEYLHAPKGTVPAVIGQNISRFYVEHPEYRLGPDVSKWADHVYNWAEPEVRCRKLAFVRELCAYDVDGLELDFMRHLPYFRLAETTSEQRRSIMAEFVRQARRALDETARGGRRRWLCVRVPAFLDRYDPNGLEVPAFLAAGVDMVNISTTYYTEQDTDLAAIRALAPAASVYCEMTHCTHKQNSGPETGNRLATPRQILTTAHQAYARAKVDGVSFYNFVYYRSRQPFASGGEGLYEPPFEVLRQVGDPAWLARQPQQWFLAPGSWTNGFGQHQVPRALRPGEQAVFRMDLLPPDGGWRGEGKLRLQARAPLAGAALSAKVNGLELEATGDVSDPYGAAYRVLTGTPGHWRAWRVPAGTLKDGANTIHISLRKGLDATLVYLDLVAGSASYTEDATAAETT